MTTIHMQISSRFEGKIDTKPKGLQIQNFEPATCRSTKGLHGLGAEGEWTTQQLTQPSTTRFGNQDHHKILETEHRFSRVAWSAFCITCGCYLPQQDGSKKGSRGA